jgi:hypothetical protein
VKRYKSIIAAAGCWLLAAPPFAYSASHREAPITALDHPADITDFYAFVSYDHPDRVTFILNTDAFLEPANGPNYFPFDPDLVYTIKIDNTYDAVEDLSFQFRFKTEIRAPGVFTGFVGAGAGINSPANAPLTAKGTRPTAVIPPAITALDGAGAAGLSLRQSYTVTLVTGSGDSATSTDLTPASQTLFAVPSNAGPRTMPNYAALAAQGIYTLPNGIRVFAGTVDDPFFIDLGAAFDSLNLRAGAFPSGTTGVMTVNQDTNDGVNTAPDTVSGYNVNSIVIEVPTAMITQPGMPVIGAWGATYRASTTVRTAGAANQTSGPLVQIQRMGNPLINELIIGTGDKDKWSQSQPADDKQFAAYDLDPLVARALNAVFGIQVPNAPRTDLLPLVQYNVPNNAGPIADLLRLDTSVKPTPMASRSRLGGLAGDAAGFPNGRRVSDDVVDIALRVVAGALVGSPYNSYRLGDGVNHNDVPTQETFPYVAFAQSGHDRVHINPGGSGCFTPVGFLGTAPCPVQ